MAPSETPTAVKICGLKTPEQVDHAIRHGAAYIGFVLFPKSPRNLAFDDAVALARHTGTRAGRVALIVNPDDALIDAVTASQAFDILQLHGTETPERVAEIKARSGLIIMKAIGIADAGDLAKIDHYAPVVDRLLIDAKPPKDAVLPGGNGLAFDWRLLAGRVMPRPWMLAGGLTPDNVAEAIALTGAPCVDVSTGVESAPGQKDLGLIADFLAAAMMENEDVK